MLVEADFRRSCGVVVGVIGRLITDSPYLTVTLRSPAFTADRGTSDVTGRCPAGFDGDRSGWTSVGVWSCWLREGGLFWTRRVSFRRMEMLRLAPDDACTASESCICPFCIPSTRVSLPAVSKISFGGTAFASS